MGTHIVFGNVELPRRHIEILRYSLHAFYVAQDHDYCSKMSNKAMHRYKIERLREKNTTEKLRNGKRKVLTHCTSGRWDLLAVDCNARAHTACDHSSLCLSHSLVAHTLVLQCPITRRGLAGPVRHDEASANRERLLIVRHGKQLGAAAAAPIVHHSLFTFSPVIVRAWAKHGFYASLGVTIGDKSKGRGIIILSCGSSCDKRYYC